MANNRLYIGNKRTKEKVMIAKGFGSGWELREERVTKFIENFENINESDVGKKTDLVLFTEYDDELFEYFFEQ